MPIRPEQVKVGLGEIIVGGTTGVGSSVPLSGSSDVTLDVSSGEATLSVSSNLLAPLNSSLWVVSGNDAMLPTILPLDQQGFWRVSLDTSDHSFIVSTNESDHHTDTRWSISGTDLLLIES